MHTSIALSSISGKAGTGLPGVSAESMTRVAQNVTQVDRMHPTQFPSSSSLRGFIKFAARVQALINCNFRTSRTLSSLVVARHFSASHSCFAPMVGANLPVGLGLLVAAVAVLLVSSAALPNFLKMSTSDNNKSDEQPEDFQYYQIYSSENGTTHFTKCQMHGFDLKSYSSKPQFVKSDFGGEPNKIVFTELAPGLEQDLHCCPQVQFVVTLKGSWYVKTSDGTKHVFKPGDVLFQDNTKDSPAANKPQHYSGVVGDKPCQQMIVQVSRTPEVNNPNPF